MEEELSNFSVDLEVIAVNDGSKIWMQGLLVISIDSIRPYTEDDIIFAEEFFKSIKEDGDYHIFSCLCGMPDCGGWEEKIQVSTKNEVLKWVEPNNNKTWYFDKSKIEEQIKVIEKEVYSYKTYFKKKQIDYVGVGYAW